MALEVLKGKTAFVTGAASGIGQGIAQACGNAGMNVILVDLRAKALAEAAVWFEQKGYPHHTIELDVTDRAGYAKAADNAEAKFGKVHLLVNNAGVEVPMVPLWKSTYDDIDFITGVNIHGVLNGIVTFVPRMLNYGEAAHVVNTSSQSGLSVVPGATLYNLTKAAIAAMTETLKGDLKGTNVDASVFAPGPVQGNLSVTSYEVRPESLGNKAEIPVFAPPPEVNPAEISPTAGFTPQPELDFSKATISALEAGERVLNGVQRGDLYIFTHPEFAPGIKNKYEAMLRAYPAETKIDPVRTQIFEGFFSFLTQNPVYAEQKPVPGFYK